MARLVAALTGTWARAKRISAIASVPMEMDQQDWLGPASACVSANNPIGLQTLAAGLA